MSTNESKIRFRRGTSTKRDSSTETLFEGQPFFETDSGILYVGNGENISESIPVKATPIEHQHDYAPVDLIEYSTTDIGTEAELATGHLYVVYQE